jgi:hypothetical protein
MGEVSLEGKGWLQRKSGHSINNGQSASGM